MIWIASHRRSGTHLMMETLNLNFNLKLTDKNKNHESYDELMKRAKKGDTIIYVIRDGRDVLLSCYNWWSISNESVLSNIMGYFIKASFTDYLRRQIHIPNFKPNMVQQWEYDQGIINDPVFFWSKHVLSFLGKENVIIFKYEDLKNKGKIQKLGETLGYEHILYKNIRVINRPVGYYIGDKEYIGSNKNKWKTEYTESDITYFNNLASSLLRKLRYEVR